MRLRRLFLRAMTVCAALALGLYCLGVMPARAAGPPPAPGGFGPVTSGIPGKCLDVLGNSQSQGTPVDLYTCNYSPAQAWTANSNGTLTINGLCLDIHNNGTANGATVDLWACNGGGNQQWAQQNGALVNPQSGRCLDDPGATSADGTQLEIWDCNGGQSQEWSEASLAQLSNPGGDMVVSIDDGGVNPSVASQAISVTLPHLLGLGANPALGDLIQANYQKGLRLNVPNYPPPNFAGGSISVSGSTITVDIPAYVVDVHEASVPEWLGNLLAGAMAIAATSLGLAVCAALFVPGGPLAQPLCWGFGAFLGTIVGSYMNHLILNTPNFSWVNTLSLAIAAAVGGAGLAYWGPGLMGVVGSKMAPVRAAILGAISRMGAWLGSQASYVYNATAALLTAIVVNWGTTLAQVGRAVGFNVPSTNPGAFPSGVSGMCLDAYGAVDAVPNGNIADVYQCNNLSAQTSWTWYYGDMLTAFGRCLDVANNLTANGSVVDLWECNGGANQRWVRNGNEFVNPQSGRCLDDPGLSTRNGTQLDIWDCNGGPNQQW